MITRVSLVLCCLLFVASPAFAMSNPPLAACASPSSGNIPYSTTDTLAQDCEPSRDLTATNRADVTIITNGYRYRINVNEGPDIMAPGSVGNAGGVSSSARSRAQTTQADCSRRLGAIGAICSVPGSGPTLEIWEATPDSGERFLLRVTQPQANAAAPGSLITSTPDGRVAVRLELDRNITISMGPDPEGKIHHVTLQYNLHGPVIATAVTYGGPPAAPAMPSGQVTVYRQPARPDGSIIHVVRPGHTLNAIARVHHVDPQDIIERNGLKGTGSLLYVGQVLVIRDAPPPDAAAVDECGNVIHVVQRGETLYSIARAWRIRRDYLYVRNQLTEGGRWIYPGQELIIPALTPLVDEADEADLAENCAAQGPLRHTVRAGHTLYTIALVYGVDREALVQRNQLTEGGRWLYPGQLLVIRDASPPHPDDDADEDGHADDGDDAEHDDDG